MLNVNDATKAAYTSGLTLKSLVISFPNANVTLQNSDIVNESLTLEESIEESGNLTYQGCIASKLTFQCADVIQDLRNEYVEVSITAGTTETIPLFKGYVVDQTNPTHEDILTTITAYDVMSKILEKDVTSWYNGLTFPITVKNFRDSFFTHCGVTQETVTLINDTLTLSKTITDGAINGAKIIKGICQLNARYGQIGRDGKFHYRKLGVLTEALYPSLTLFPDPSLYPAGETTTMVANKADYINVKYEPFKTDAVNKVTIYNQNGVSGGSYGSGSNEFSIADNPIAYGVSNMTTAAQNIYGEISKIQFTPANVELVGLPFMECGDSLMINTLKNIVRTYILKRTLKGVQVLKDNYESQSTKSMPVHKTSLATSVSKNAAGVAQNAADIVRANQLIADRATIGQLDAVSARVGSLEADHVTTAQLNATNAAIYNLATIAITTQNLSSQSISAGQITSGTISASRIAADTFSGRDMSSKSISCTGYMSTPYISVNGVVFASSAKVRDINGNEITVLKTN